KENHSTVSGSPVPRGAGCDLEDLCGQVRGYRRATGRRRVDRGGDQGVLSEGVPAEADAEGISRIPRPGIPFGGGPDQGAAATGLREVHQRVLPWRIPVPGVRTGTARGTCVSGHGDLSSALHRTLCIRGGGGGKRRARKEQGSVSLRGVHDCYE